MLFSVCILFDSNLYIQIYFKSKSSVLIFESNEGFGGGKMQNQACLFADMSLVRWLRFKIIPLYKSGPSKVRPWHILPALQWV